MESEKRLVGRDQDAELQTLRDQSIDQVPRPSQPCPSALFGIGREKLVAVLEDEQARRARLPLVVIVEEDVDEVARVASEEGFRIEHVLEPKRVPVLPRQG